MTPEQWQTLENARATLQHLSECAPTQHEYAVYTEAYTRFVNIMEVVTDEPLKGFTERTRGNRIDRW